MSSSAPTTWTCAQCSSTFDKSKLLERHALQTSHKAYKCSKCPKTFGKRTALIRHNATHSDVKSHACRVCGKAFYRKDHCAEHEEVCTHRLAVETRERLSASLAGSAATSNDNVIATSETTSPNLLQDQTISHATDSRKRYREVDGDGDQSGSSSKTPADDLRYTPRPELQELRTSEPDRASRHNEADILENAGQNVSYTEGPLPEALLQQYPALRDIEWSNVPPMNGYSPNFSTWECIYHGCVQRFSSPASLETHKREYHRAPVANTRGSETDESPTRQTSRLDLLDPANAMDNLAANPLSPSRTTNPHGPGIDSTPGLPVHLISMWPSSRESMPTNTSTPNNGLYTCTYPGCTRRFDSLTEFQKHKRDFHRLGDDLALASSPPSTMTLPPLPSTCRLTLCAHHGCTQRFSRRKDYERHCREHHYPRDNAPPSSQITDPQRATTDSAADLPAHLVSIETSLREQPPVKTNLTPSIKILWTRRPRILVVEGDRFFPWIAPMFLAGFNCFVDRAIDALEAVTRLGSGTIELPDLIFMDATMEILDWEEAIRLIRHTDQTKSVPIIIMTSNMLSDDISMHFQHGVSDVLPKPFEREDLFRMLEKHLAHLIKED